MHYIHVTGPINFSIQRTRIDAIMRQAIITLDRLATEQDLVISKEHMEGGPRIYDMGRHSMSNIPIGKYNIKVDTN